MPPVNTALLIITFVRQSGRSAYCHCRREKVRIQGVTNARYWLVNTWAHAESEGCLGLISTRQQDTQRTGIEDLRVAGMHLSVASSHHDHEDQSRAARRGGVRRAMRSRWGLSHNLPRQEWQPQAD